MIRATALGFCLAALAVTATAGTGGPDSFGYAWADHVDGCDNDPPSFSGGEQVFNGLALRGPFPLGFTTAYYGEPVDQAWVSPAGFVSFSDQGTGAPQMLPDGTPPNHLIAAYWNNPDDATIRVEARPDVFHVRWTHSFGIIGNQVTDLRIYRDGSFHFYWGNDPITPTLDLVVGYEDRLGAEGVSLYHRVGFNPPTRDGFFPDPVGGVAACVTLAPRLDCDLEPPIRCGETANGSLPGADGSPANNYLCTPAVYDGSETVIRVQVDEPTPATVFMDEPSFDLLYVGMECSEGACIALADPATDRFDFPVLLPGEHLFVVDSTDPGAAGAFDLSVTCGSPFTTLDCAGTVSGDTSGGQNLIREYGCAGVPLDGPEAAHEITLASAAPLVVSLAAGDPDLWVLIFDETGRTCLGAGRGAASHIGATAGTYLVVVDGQDGAAGAYTLQAGCEVQLDCSVVTPVSCGQLITGDTTLGQAGAALYGCLSDVLDGRELVYSFDNPVQQTISADFISSQPGQRVMLLEECSEGLCRLEADQDFSCALLDRGPYLLVVDGPAGGEGPFELQLSCREVGPGLDVRATAIDATALAEDCRTFEVDGPVDVTIANLGTDVVLAPFDVLVFEDDPMNANQRFDPLTDNPLGRFTVTTDLAPGEGRTVTVDCVGTIQFRDNVLHAVVDPDGVLVGERDLDNNYWDSGRGCEWRPPIGEFELREEWIWNSSTVLPDYVHVDTTPMVGDVNADGVPDIVINAGFDEGGYDEGVVRVLDGRDGTEIWTGEDLNTATFASSSLAIGNLDADPQLEIVAHANFNRDTLLALDHDGTLLWQSQPFINHPSLGGDTVGGGGASLADIDCDGTPEVVYGANVFNGADGTYFWTPDVGGTLGINGSTTRRDGPLSVVVDLDGDGTLEVVAGPTAYAWNPASGRGEIVWNNPAVPDGNAAVGNFDGDDEPEIVITARGTVYVLEGLTGALKWQREIPIGTGVSCQDDPPNRVSFRGGAPTVADFDGDCEAEIGVAGADLYVVMETNGDIRWTAPIDDCSSHRTASTVFDFDGDGAAEVAFMDQSTLHVFRGIDGEQIASRPSSSHTWQEMVSIADVDGDNNAEIIMPVNGGGMIDRSGDGLPDTVANGVWVIGDIDGDWVNTRRIWNQHAYHIDHVTDEGEIVGGGDGCEEPSWLEHGTYRDQLGTAIFTAPDVTISVISIEILVGDDCSRDVRIVARVGNGGGIPIGRMITASFYDGHPSMGVSLSSVDIRDLAPGEFEDYEIIVPAPRFGSLDIWALADDDGSGLAPGLVNECREDNNLCLATVDNSETGSFGDPPAAVGNSLRATAHGDPYAPDITAEFNWFLDEGLPRDPMEQYHVRRADDPRDLVRVSPEPHQVLTWSDSTPASMILPRVHYYRVFAVDQCGTVEEAGQ